MSISVLITYQSPEIPSQQSLHRGRKETWKQKRINAGIGRGQTFVAKHVVHLFLQLSPQTSVAKNVLSHIVTRDLSGSGTRKENPCILIMDTPYPNLNHRYPIRTHTLRQTQATFPQKYGVGPISITSSQLQTHRRDPPSGIFCLSKPGFVSKQCFECLQIGHALSTSKYVVAVQLLSRVQLFSNPEDCSPPGSSVHGILQARIPNGLPFPSPGDLPDSGMKSTSAALASELFTTEPPGKPTSKHVLTFSFYHFFIQPWHTDITFLATPGLFFSPSLKDN